MSSSQTFEFNVNEVVLVRLTDFGRRIHRERFDALLRRVAEPSRLTYRPPKEDKDGWSRWQMWDLMETFGEQCGLGSSLPFECTIRIEIEKAK